jgi:hypothetical protein
MSKKIISLLAMFLFLAGISMGQTDVPEGDGTLKEAITDASPGDVLVLVSGGLYTEVVDTAYFISKPLTIKAADGATKMPMVQMLSVEAGTTEEGPQFFILEDGASLTLQGLEFNGLAYTPDTANYVAVENLFYFPLVNNKQIGTVKLYDCYVHNMTNKIFAGYDSDIGSLENVNIDSVIVENSRFYMVEAIKFRYVGLNYLMVENCTFWDMPDFGIYLRGIGGKEAVVNHCTFHNVGNAMGGMNGSTDPMTRFRMDTPSSISVKNSIFTFQEDEPAVDVRDDGITGVISHCCLFEVLGGLVPASTTVSDTIIADPKYANAAVGDFTLAGDSPCLGQADDGNAMGDLRWDPNLTSIQDEIQIAETFKLAQNFPNPFNPETTIEFTLENSAHTNLSIYNMLGQHVATLLDSKMASGVHEVSFNAGNLSSGIYLYKIVAGEQVAIKKMVLMK